MKYKLLGNTGLRVSELCLGTMTFGGKGYWTNIGTLDQQSVDHLVGKSIEGGINFIDTANVYSEGLAEEMTGKAIRNLKLKRDDLVIATKVRGKMSEGPNGSGLARKHILHEVEASLKRLNMDYIDLYQIHGFDELTPLEETIDVLDSLVKSGKGALHWLQQPGRVAYYESFGIFSVQSCFTVRVTPGLLHHFGQRH